MEKNVLHNIFPDILRPVINLLFPRRCPVCGDIVVPEGALICPSCIPKLSPVMPPTCKKCGKEVFSEHMEYCLDCTRHKRSFQSGVALLNYNDTAQKSMAAIKYRNRREYLDFYAQAITFRYGKWMARIQPDALIPVPVHPARLRKRGFNQAEELANRLSRMTGIPVNSKLLIRTRKTAPQKELSPAERLNNLQQAFAVSSIFQHSDSISLSIPSRVILVDDIYTTGSTVESCSRILKQSGVEEVYYIAICIGKGK